MPSGSAAETRALVASGAALVAAKLGASLLILYAGFRAVSDDDYARIVIAQRFAAAPSLDPSGTSWLPLPFWIYGSALAVFEDDLAAARGVALISGAAAVLAVWLAARWVGGNATAAWLAGLLAALFPWSVWLGAAPLPEAPAAGLLVLAMAGLASRLPARRLFGAVAVAAACFCRYEAWPVAATFALFTTLDARAARGDRRLVASAVVSLLPIGLWLAHGVARHGDALFFWKRVAGYRQALGGGAPLLERVASVPVALVREEPGLIVLVLVLLPALRASWSELRRPLAAGLALVLFLLAGELGGGGPTHHGARPLLPVWYLAALLAGVALSHRLARAQERVWLVAPLAALALSWSVHGFVPRHFPDRSNALAIGARAKELNAPSLLIDTPDYSYLAVTAAFGRPNAAVPLDDRDPRSPRAAAVFGSANAVRAALQRAPGAWLVASRSHADSAARAGRVREENPDYLLVEPSR